MEEKIQAAAAKSEGSRAMGYHCSESCIRACQERLDMILPDEILRISSGCRGGRAGIVMKRLLEGDRLIKEMPESGRYENRQGLQSDKA